MTFTHQAWKRTIKYNLSVHVEIWYLNPSAIGRLHENFMVNHLFTSTAN